MTTATIASLVALALSALHALVAAWVIGRQGRAVDALNDRLLALERAHPLDTKTRVWRLTKR